MKKILSRYHYVFLIGIIAFAFVTRVVRLNLPEIYIFDEVYHAVTAKLIARDDPRAYEWWNPPVEPNTAVDWLHPPYAKYTQAFFILMFGENTFGWRISSVIFGVLTIVMVYKLSQELFGNRNLSLLATLLASLDGLLLVQSRIAMNDIHVTFFILLTLLFYLRYAKSLKPQLLLLTGLSAGLAMGSKWSGVFALLAVGIFEAKRLLKQKPPQPWTQNLLKLSLVIFSLIILPMSIYLASYTHMFWQGKSLFCWQNQPIQGECYKEHLQFGPWTFDGYLSHFGELHRQIWWYQTSLTATHGYQSRPWQWFLNLRPVWFHVEYQTGLLTNIYAQGNTVLFWLGDLAVISSVLIWFIKTISKLTLKLASILKFKLAKPIVRQLKRLNDFVLPKNLIFLLFAYFIVWLPWQLSPRIMFFYHYTPAVPLLAILLAYWLTRLSSWRWRGIGWGQILVCLAIIGCGLNFALFYPNWTGLSVPEQLFKPLYFALKSWK